ncbi:MAG: hypothetical protein QXE31_01605 [Candidatus Woesearchaeota archaeon]
MKKKLKKNLKETSENKKKQIIEIDQFLKDEERQIFSKVLNSLLNEIKEKNGLQEYEIKIYFEKKEIQIPCSIFEKDLGILEAIVKYLHENLNLSFKEISKLIKRSHSNVISSYNNAVKKKKNLFNNINYKYSIPLSIFEKKLTCFESICLYFKDRGLKLIEIAKLLNRNNKTIWTIYIRALKKKRGDKK